MCLLPAFCLCLTACCRSLEWLSQRQRACCDQPWEKFPVDNNYDSSVSRSRQGGDSFPPGNCCLVYIFTSRRGGLNMAVISSLMGPEEWWENYTYYVFGGTGWISRQQKGRKPGLLGIFITDGNYCLSLEFLGIASTQDERIVGYLILPTQIDGFQSIAFLGPTDLSLCKWFPLGCLTDMMEINKLSRLWDSVFGKSMLRLDFSKHMFPSSALYTGKIGQSRLAKKKSTRSKLVSVFEIESQEKWLLISTHTHTHSPQPTKPSIEPERLKASIFN